MVPRSSSGTPDSLNVILPFVDRFPTDLELYKIMTTKWTDKKEAENG